MALSDKNKAYLIGGATLVAIVLLLLLVGEIVLPFVLALFVAYLLNPLIRKIQTKIKNRVLAVTSFLLVLVALLVGIVVFFGSHILKDSKRLIGAVNTFAQDNKQEIDELKTNAVNFFDEVAQSDAVQQRIASSDTLSTEEKEQDLTSAIESVYSLFEKEEGTKDAPKRKPWNPYVMLIYTLAYTVIILCSYAYFEQKYRKYFGNRKPSNKFLEGIFADFKNVFLKYFRQRAKVVAINMVIFITAFSILDLPGAIVLGIVTGLLTYASHFHYLSLPLVAIGCWVLSVEHDIAFLLYFGILLAVYIIVSVLDETVYFNRIMKSVNGMNSAIALLSFTLWIAIFGGFMGTVIALPLTQLIMIYMGRLLLNAKEKEKKTTD